MTCSRPLLSPLYRWANWGTERLLNSPKFPWLVSVSWNLNFRRVCRPGLVPNCQTAEELDSPGPAPLPPPAGLLPPSGSNSDPLRWGSSRRPHGEPRLLGLEYASLPLVSRLTKDRWLNHTELQFHLLYNEAHNSAYPVEWLMRVKWATMCKVLTYFSSSKLCTSSSFLPFYVFAK